MPRAVPEIPWAKRPENKAARLAYMAQWRRDNPLRACVHSMVGGARSRARAAGRTADLAYLTVAAVLKLVPDDLSCACCGNTMVAEVENGKHPRAISLDRVENDRGYVAGNVAVICMLCNSRKREMTIAEIKQLAEYVSLFDL